MSAIFLPLRVRAVFVCASLLTACSGTSSTPTDATNAQSTAIASTSVPTPVTAAAPLVITGLPPSSIKSGETYEFKPTASGGSSSTLVFAAKNLPSWASLDAATGHISGIPGDKDVGSYAGITITVTSGSNTADLGPFSINVVALAQGNVELSWLPPTQNEDGSLLTDLSGYHILYGRSPQNLDHVIVVDNPSVNTYLVDNLSEGTWYFGLVARTPRGESEQSSVKSKDVTG